MNAVWAVYNNTDQAEQAVACLQKSGLTHSQISMMSDNKDGLFAGGGVSLMLLPQVGPVAVDGPLSRMLRDGSALKGMERWGLSADAMQAVMQALQNGGSVVAVDVNGEMQVRAEECLYRYSPHWSSQAERNHAHADKVAHSLMQATDDEEILIHEQAGMPQTTMGATNSRMWASTE